MKELKVYVIDGFQFQFREGEQPAGATLLEDKPKAAPKRTTSKTKKAEEE